MSTPLNDAEEDDVSPDAPGRMSFLDHLDELRRRILYAVYSILAATLVSFAFIDKILAAVTAPMIAVLPSGKFLGTEALDPIMLYFKAGLLVAVLIASPLILLQVWYFIAPGLYAKEKRIAVPFVLVSTMLFLGGAYFGHAVAFRVTWDFLIKFTPTNFMEFQPTATSVFSLYLKMVLGLGLIFEMPAVVFVLARFGLVTPKFLLKNFKYAVLIIFIVAAVASPGQDPASQMLFAAPMLVLYVISIGVAWLFGKKKPREADEQ
jgi:sec-independent protein translocase protein TatC